MKSLCSLLLLLAPFARADEPAVLMPGDTFLYLEADAVALEKGIRELDVAKTLADPKFRGFFLPGMRKLELDPSDPAGSFVKKLGLREWLAGRAAVGVRGLSVAFGERPRATYTPDNPVGAAFFHELFGALLTGVLSERQRGGLAVRLDIDFTAVLEPGPKLEAWLKGLLANPPFELKRRVVQIGDHELLHLSFPAIALPERGAYYAPQFYLRVGKKRWLAASDAKVLVRMLDGPVEQSLSKAPRFQAVRDRLTTGNRVIFAYLDARRAMRMFARFVPPVLTDLLEQHGLASMVGAGLGVSFVEGGVRESFGVALDGEPRGVWKVLDAFPPGLRSVEIAPKDALAVGGLKLDLGLLVQRLKEVGNAAAPGTGDALEQRIRKALTDNEMDADAFLKAFGDEMGLFVLPPAGMTPDWAFSRDLRDLEAAATTIAKLKATLGFFDVAFPEAEIEPGLKGFRVAGAWLGDQPWGVTAKKHLFLASRREVLVDILNKWGTKDEPTLRDNEQFARTMRGLNGVRVDELVFLAYVDLRNGLPLAASMLPFMAPRDLEEFVDLDHMPDLTHLTARLAGAAAGLRREKHGVTIDLYSPFGAVIIAPLITPKALWKLR
jgi:hypothetical protein